MLWSYDVETRGEQMQDNYEGFADRYDLMKISNPSRKVFFRQMGQGMYVPIIGLADSPFRVKHDASGRR